MISRFLRISFISALFLSACISVPDRLITVDQKGAAGAGRSTGSCDAVQPGNRPVPGPAEKPELDSRRFDVLTWNVLRGGKEGWKEDFVHLSAYKDILAIQEARLTDDLRKMLDGGRYYWIVSAAFTYNGAETGVLTASRFEPSFSCALRTKEPLINIPKTIQITIYPLSGSDESLMIVNIHAVNFTLGTESFRRQLQEVEKVLLQHTGPVIFSGDVNTWSRKRMMVLDDFAGRLGLKAVHFEDRHRTRIFGNNIDHVFYRGLTVLDAKVIKVNSSDHNPMMVSFRLDGIE